MKAGLTKSSIDAFADALASVNATDAAAPLKALSAMFKGFATRPMEDLLNVLDEVAPGQDQAAESSSADRVAAVIPGLRGLELVLSNVSTHARLHDLTAFRTRLQRHESASIESVVKAVQVLRRGNGGEGRVDSNHYKRLAEELRTALGRDDQFNPLFEQLSELNAAGVAEVTNALMSSGSSKSRKEDLRRIRERHESQRLLLAKQRAMAGRTAA